MLRDANCRWKSSLTDVSSKRISFFFSIYGLKLRLFTFICQDTSGKRWELDDPVFSRSTREQLLFVRFNPFGFHGRVPSEAIRHQLSSSFSLFLCLSRRTELWKIENGIKILQRVYRADGILLGGKWRKYVRPRNRSVRLIEKLSREQAKKMRLCDPLTQIARHTPPIYPGE